MMLSKIWLYLKSVIYLWPAILLLLQFFPQLYFCPVSMENSFYQVFSSPAIVTIAWCKCRSSRESLVRDEVWWTLTLLGSLSIWPQNLKVNDNENPSSDFLFSWTQSKKLKWAKTSWVSVSCFPWARVLVVCYLSLREDWEVIVLLPCYNPSRIIITLM